jgi:hypothetical protein
MRTESAAQQFRWGDGTDGARMFQIARCCRKTVIAVENALLADAFRHGFCCGKLMCG